MQQHNLRMVISVSSINLVLPPCQINDHFSSIIQSQKFLSLIKSLEKNTNICNTK